MTDEIETWTVDSTSSEAISFTADIYDFNSDQMTFSFTGFDKISEFATLEIGEQSGMKKSFTITVDPSKLPSSYDDSYTITLIAKDGFLESEPLEFVITIFNEVGNGLIEIESPSSFAGFVIP